MAQPIYQRSARNDGRGTPLNINTNQPVPQPARGGGRGTSRDRFSWLETPVEMQEPQIRAPLHEPTESPIPQSPPETPSYQQSRTPQPDAHVYQTPHSLPRSTSPYELPEPAQPHPAYFAPVVPDSQATVPHSRPGSVPLPSQSPAPAQSHQLANPTSQKPIPIEETSSKKPPLSPEPPIQRQSTQPIFSPSSFAGPNGPTLESHQPGQVPHPNMDLSAPGSKAPWIHGLCECSTDVGTCLTGIFCPCILDSRTAYRMAARTEHRDPTDLLGFENVNGRCMMMTLLGFCGLFCILPLTLRTRIRHSYHLTGNFGSDVLEACCCCCCVAIQNEREVRDREDKLRAWAGPAQGATLAGGVGFERTNGMTYAPGGGI